MTIDHDLFFVCRTSAHNSSFVLGLVTTVTRPNRDTKTSEFESSADPVSSS